MKIATWNINGVRARLDRLTAWLDAQGPDVVCLQETKCEDDRFPRIPFETRGYHVALHGQKAYNGVAILSRPRLSEIRHRFDDEVLDGQARLLAATAEGGLRLVAAYFPNGKSVESESYAHKLVWMERLRARLAADVRAADPWILCGDFNVAPHAIDVHDPVAWQGQVLVSDREREALERIRQVGFVDAVRALHPTTALYTWWDYRMLAFPKNQGLRIDHMFVTPSLAPLLVRAEVDREARKGTQPSDHAPVVITLRDSQNG